MDQSENNTSPQKDSSSKVKYSTVIPPFAPGNPDADKYAAEQTAAAAVPTIGDLQNLLECMPILIEILKDYIPPMPKPPSGYYCKPISPKTYTKKPYPDPSLYFKEALRALEYFLSGKMKIGAQQAKPAPYFLSSWSEMLIRRAKMDLLNDAVWNTNVPFMPENDDRKSNCQRCALVLYERLCGNNVCALNSGKGDPFLRTGSLLTVFSERPKTFHIQKNNAAELKEWLDNYMKEKGEYAVIAIGVHYKNQNQIGHMFNVVRLNDKTHYVDAQKRLFDAEGTLDTVNYEKPITIIDLNGATFNEKFPLYIGL